MPKSTKSKSAAAAKEIGYAKAMEELEQILDELEDDNVDIDALTSQVKRAAELIALCRGRIQNAQVQVRQIVADLDQPNNEASD